MGNWKKNQESKDLSEMKNISAEHTVEMQLALEILEKKGWLWTKVTANNSKPLILEDDTVCLKKLDSDMRVGDLVAMDSLKMIIIHRILKINGNEITTKADISDKGPFTYNSDRVIGRVVIVKNKDVYIKIDTRTAIFINRIIARLSYNRSVEFRKKNLFYYPFFMRLRRSMMKRLLKLEKYLGKTNETKLNTTI